MAITPNSLDYSAKDFASLRRRLFALIASVFPTWTDTDVANFGNILVELNARMGDVLLFYQDRQAKESRITTALLRKNVLALAKLVGFAPQGAKAAQVVETFTIVNSSGVITPAAAPVTIPAGTPVGTLSVPTSVSFQVLENVTIPAGQASADGLCENSASYTDSFVSTGLADQSFRLSRTPYLDGSLVVSAGNGAFTEVVNFLDSTGVDLHFDVTVDENDSAVVTFGDGNLGAIPTGTVFLEYRTWGGFVGKVVPGAVSRIIGSFVDGHGNSVRVVVTNAQASTPGVDRQSVGLLRQLIPEQTRVQERAVAREDFEIGAQGVQGVARALMLTANEDPGVQENTGALFIVPVGGGAATQVLLDSVKARFVPVSGYSAPDLPALGTFRLNVYTAQYVAVNVYAKIYKRRGFTAAQTRAIILTALQAFFAITNADGSRNTAINFGYYLQAADGTPTNSLAYSDIFNCVRDCTAVLKIGASAADFLVNDLHADVQLAPRSFPTFGSLTLLDADTGQLIT